MEHVWNTASNAQVARLPHTSHARGRLARAEFEQAHPQMGGQQARISLLIAQGDLAAAKLLVEEAIGSEQLHEELEVLHMYLATQLAQDPLAGPDAAAIQRLQELASQSGPGQVPAQAWLRGLGLLSESELIILPSEERSMLPPMADETAMENQLLSVYPNPATNKAPVYLVALLPEKRWKKL
ncbi:MAG: hypothetical protein IPP33_03110 [Flavobacteriales bacterium]|nr:hypothetical protein [Flavobacteriales bacterium]